MRLTTVLCVLISLGGLAAAGDVGWRVDGTGRAPDTEPPTAFSPTENVVWKTPLPAWSNASPTIVGDRIFVCAEPDILLALDKTTGKILWQAASPLGGDGRAGGGKRIKTHKENGYSSPTPASDGERVYVSFGNGVIVAHDLDGKRVWAHFVEPPKHPWGHCASPLLVGGKLIVHHKTLKALDAATGKVLWKQDKEAWVDVRKKKWGSPVAAKIGDVDVIVSAWGRVIRAEDGAVLFEPLGNIVFNSPLVHDGVVYLFQKKGARAIRLPDSVDGKPEILWNTPVVKERFYASPLFHEGRVYAISQGGSFSAFDAKTGRELFRQKLTLGKNINSAYSSVTLGGDKIYLMGMNGSILVVEPGDTYRQIAATKVEKELRSNPVFEGTRMYVRAPSGLYCFGK